MARLGRLGHRRTAFQLTLALCTFIALAILIPLYSASVLPVGTDLQPYQVFFEANSTDLNRNSSKACATTSDS